MDGLKNFIKTIRRIERGYNIFLKIMKYVDKALIFYPMVDGILKKLNASEND